MGRQAIDEIDGLLAELTERAASGEQRGAVEALGDLVLVGDYQAARAKARALGKP